MRIYIKIGENQHQLLTASEFVTQLSSEFSEKSVVGLRIKSWMIFPYAGISTNISCVIFNSIYTKNCMLELWNALFPPKETPQLLLQQWMSDASIADIKKKSTEEIFMAKTLTLNPKRFNNTLFSDTRLNGVDHYQNESVEGTSHKI